MLDRRVGKNFADEVLKGRLACLRVGEFGGKKEACSMFARNSATRSVGERLGVERRITKWWAEVMEEYA